MAKTRYNAPHLLLSQPVLLFVLFLNTCGGKKLPAPQGWFIGSQVLASTQNQILSAGTTLHLPQKFMLTAATDCIVRLTQQASGEALVQLHVGTAIVERTDPHFPLVLLANGHLVRLADSRLLVQNQVGSTRIALLNGEAAINDDKDKWELSLKTHNLFEMKAGTRIVRKLTSRDIDRLFPEVGRARLLLAVR